jgi:predicted ribosomally synthesized peptide with nif11-like leader
MSRENVALFSTAISRNPDLNRRISEAGTNTNEWVAIAGEVGFEFTADEFASVVGQTLGRTVTPANAVREYLGAQYKVGELDLSRKTLDAVVGGARRGISNLK